MKSLNTLIKTLFVILLVIPAGLFAQDKQQFVELDNIEMTSVDNKMVLTWKTALEPIGDYFLVEKLDANWDYQEVGKVNINEPNGKLTTYSIEDANPVEGENYYRITVVDTSGDKFLTDLLIADHFVQPETTKFEFLFNDKFSSYALTNADIDIQPLSSGIFGEGKYAQNTLKVRRLRSTMLNAEMMSGAAMNTLVATLD